jgi:hypothetical protein
VLRVLARSRVPVIFALDFDGRIDSSQFATQVSFVLHTIPVSKGRLFCGSLIRTCELNGANAFDCLIELQKHAQEVAENPSAWMPWNCQEVLAENVGRGAQLSF